MTVDDWLAWKKLSLPPEARAVAQQVWAAATEEAKKAAAARVRAVMRRYTCKKILPALRATVHEIERKD